jgi:hypothetical protein
MNADSEPNYPYILECYLLCARNKLPPHPESEPVKRAIIYSREQSDRLKREWDERYPDGWKVERPIN